MEAKKGLKLVGYARVSTDNQANEGTIEIQIHALHEYCQTNGYELVAVYSDNGVSGGLEDRPGLSSLFECLDENDSIDGVLIFKLDRLGHTFLEQEGFVRDIQGRKKRLLSVSEPDIDSKDPSLKLIRQVSEIMCEYQHNLKGV